MNPIAVSRRVLRARCRKKDGSRSTLTINLQQKRELTLTLSTSTMMLFTDGALPALLHGIACLACALQQNMVMRAC